MFLHQEEDRVIIQQEEHPTQQNNSFPVLKFYPLSQLWVFIHGPDWPVTGFTILGAISIKTL